MEKVSSENLRMHTKGISNSLQLNCTKQKPLNMCASKKDGGRGPTPETKSLNQSM
jgi:hypothetical protein